MKKIHLPAYRKYVKGVGVGKQSMDWINNTAIVTGSKMKHYGHSGCFSGFAAEETEQEWDYILLQVNDKQAYSGGSSKDVLHTYYEWLLHYSLFRSVFVSKNLSRILKDRVLIIDPTKDAKLVINGMVAARMAWEQQYNTSTRIQVWYDLVQMGTDPAQAFAMVSCLVKKLKGYTLQANNNHEIFESTNEVMHLNFLEQNLNLEGHSFKEIGGYSSIGSLFKSNRDDGFDLWSFIKDRWGESKKPNDWGVSVSTLNHYTKGKFTSVVKDITTDYSSKLKELKINA
jgi:hypothetical protein